MRLHAGAFSQLLTQALRADAVVFGRRVFLSRPAAAELSRRSPEGLALLAHELAHVEQYRHRGPAGFLARYLTEYVRSRLRGKSHLAAYRSISFEREAKEIALNFVRGQGSAREP